MLFFISGSIGNPRPDCQAEALIPQAECKELVAELDPNSSWQIHRSTLVNACAIDGITRDFSGRQTGGREGPSVRLVSRSYTHLGRGCVSLSGLGLGLGLGFGFGFGQGAGGAWVALGRFCPGFPALLELGRAANSLFAALTLLKQLRRVEVRRCVSTHAPSSVLRCSGFAQSRAPRPTRHLAGIDWDSSTAPQTRFATGVGAGVRRNF